MTIKLFLSGEEKTSDHFISCLTVFSNLKNTLFVKKKKKKKTSETYVRGKTDPSRISWKNALWGMNVAADETLSCIFLN